MLINNEKQKGIYTSYSRLPLTARPLDLVYFIFFAVHLFASIVLDLQYLYPPQYVPRLFRLALDSYVSMSRDPLIGGVFNLYGDGGHLIWFKTFLALEAVFQVPVFILGLRALYSGSQRIYPLLVIYGASSATTTLACVAVVLQTPELTPETLKQGIACITSEQRVLLLSSYIPFLLIAGVMSVDMALRVGNLAEKGIKAEAEEKWE
ncbi:Sigma intracellular receptor 2 [Psilocybe cubensis]|uniref:EXPERA domain-containing protein n=2 Tax=Psilocybe cubensis TaxID=181762 RepID=A0A8H7XT60_PSICU|nr:Sigma intracellular receptor 2 [Psilocybe cubensis]KAH9479542.1 Sigma intracellular receptor 2 [Psilocybe cubensis]